MRFSAVLAIASVIAFSSESPAQRIRFSQPPPPSDSGISPAPAAGGIGVPAAPTNQGFNAPSGAMLGNPTLAPTYDPFAAPAGVPGNPAYPPGGIQPGYAPPSPYYPGWGNPPPARSPYAYPPAAPGTYPPRNAPYQNAPYQNAPYQNTPGQGIFGSGPYSQNQDWLNQFEQGRYMRVIQEFHYRHTWLEGATANEVDINDAEIGFTLNWPNFLGSGEPLLLSPTFIFHFWDGPQPPSAADLPSRAYSAFLAAAWTTPTNRNFGGEILTSVGVYTDFQTFTNRSLRVKGTGQGWVRLTPDMSLKFGVSYLNRLDVKILPVGGLYWKPARNLDLELCFPNPRIKYALPQVGNTEMSIYLTADYGGDSWTIGRQAGFSDQIDLIDLRVLGGFEFVGLGGFRGFFEAGYAFDRELLYRVTPADSIPLSDSVIVRAGFLF
ncbi:MAG: hypothetical protein VX768_09220 [Planctomycetota bacterium]|nr:hypothetical protein [Planctomycetota bacterium]